MTKLVLSLIFFSALLVLPVLVSAGIDKTADAQCKPIIPECPKCGYKKNSKGTCVFVSQKVNMLKCICKSTIKPVTGICVGLEDCLGQTAVNQQGKSQGMGDMKGFMDIMKGVMDMLKGKGGGGGGGGGSQPPSTGPAGCTAYYQVTAPSSDPCAYYVPPVSDSLLGTGNINTGASDALMNALGSGSALNVSDQLLGAINAPQPSPGAQTLASTTPGSIGGNLGSQAVNLQAGTQGNIEITPTRATLIARTRDTGANTEVAGFYGSTVSGGAQPQGLVAKMCQSRPWATSIVTYVIPPSFFDSLCAWRGYQVGAPTPPSPPVIVQQVRQTPSTSTSQTPPPASTVAPEVEIWAVPEKVPLGSRTTIFWNTKGVDSCTVISPDGSFNEHALSGGAATVPLTGATTFVISCLTSDEKPITDYVTVNLSI